MRETWIPLFQDIRNSSIWAHDSDIRIVWFTLLTMVDPEGFVAAAVPGIAIAANVPLEKARQAIALFEAPDPDSRTDAHEGRRIQKVPRGWLILNFADMRRRATHEAEKARKRRWARDNRTRPTDEPSDYLEGFVDGVDALSTPRTETVDASKSKSKSTPPKKGEGSPLPPGAVPVVWETPEELVQRYPEPPSRLSKARAASGGPCPCGDQERPGHPVGWCHQAPVEAQGTPLVFRTLEGWHPSPELRAEAVAAGVGPLVFDRRIAELRLGPIGGARGVFDRDQYVRGQFGRWRTWDETDRAKAQTNTQGLWGAGGRRPVAWEPGAKHRAFAERHGLDLDQLLKDFAGRGYTLEHYPEKDLGERFGRFLAREKARRAA